VRIVIDTNVLVSGILLPESIPGRLFDHAELDGSLLFSQATFSELREVLWRPKFDRYLDAVRRDRFIGRCLDAAALVDTIRVIRACRDPDDDKFLEVAVNGKADALITGDTDLLVLDPFEGIPIITPAACLTKIGD
jgi:putative PIN family toxin of toxin-antitoxin system